MDQEPKEPNGGNPAPPKACQKCGRCCREKVDIESVIFYTDRVCRFWDTKTRLCTVYERRQEVCPDCADMDRAIKNGILPQDCPFVADLEDYDAPVEFWEDPEVSAIIETLPEDSETVLFPRKRL